MSTPESCRGWSPAALLLSLMLSGCPASLPPAPPVIAKPPEATPLPASVSRIDPKSSQAWQERAVNFLKKLSALSEDETPK